MHMNDFNFLHTKKIMPIDFIYLCYQWFSIYCKKKHIPGRLMFM